MREHEYQAEQASLTARHAALMSGLETAIEEAERLVQRLRERQEEYGKVHQAAVERLTAQRQMKEPSSGTASFETLGSSPAKRAW